MAIITPNFNFDGKCEEAIYLYQKHSTQKSTACFGTAMQNGTIFIENCQKNRKNISIMRNSLSEINGS